MVVVVAVAAAATSDMRGGPRTGTYSRHPLPITVGGGGARPNPPATMGTTLVVALPDESDAATRALAGHMHRAAADHRDVAVAVVAVAAGADRPLPPAAGWRLLLVVDTCRVEMCGGSTADAVPDVLIDDGRCGGTLTRAADAVYAGLARHWPAGRAVLCRDALRHATSAALQRAHAAGVPALALHVPIGADGTSRAIDSGALAAALVALADSADDLFGEQFTPYRGALIGDPPADKATAAAAWRREVGEYAALVTWSTLMWTMGSYVLQ